MTQNALELQGAFAIWPVDTSAGNFDRNELHNCSGPTWEQAHLSRRKPNCRVYVDTRPQDMSRVGRLYVSLVMLVALSMLSLASSQSADAAKVRVNFLSEGHRLAESWCQACHAIEPHMAGTYDGAPSFSAIANRRGTTALSLKVFLKTSHQNMPNLVTAPEQTDALVSYILSLKTK